MTLSVKHSKNGAVDIISVEGILNADTCEHLECILDPLADSAQPYILLDIPKLSYISSAGVGCFIGVIKKIREKGGDIRFSEMNSKVSRVFHLLDMGDFFQVYSNLEDGIASYQN